MAVTTTGVSPPIMARLDTCPGDEIRGAQLAALRRPLLARTEPWRRPRPRPAPFSARRLDGFSRHAAAPFGGAQLILAIRGQMRSHYAHCDAGFGGYCLAHGDCAAHAQDER